MNKLNTFKRTDIMQSIFYKYNGIKEKSIIIKKQEIFPTFGN
jgi:hypothetical protein